jgi:signal transduction histidine kinase
MLVSITAAICQLVLGILAIARGTPPLKVPLALLCLDIAGWTAASSVHAAYPVPWLWRVDHTLSPLTALLALDFVLVYVGLRRSSHLTRLPAAVLCGTLSAATFTASFVPAWRLSLERSSRWNFCLIATSAPTMAIALVTLVRHWRQTTNADERARTSLLLMIFFTGTVFCVVDQAIPRDIGLADLGMLVCGFGMAVTTIRFRLFGPGPSGREMIALGVLVAGGLAGCAATTANATTRAAAGVTAALFLAGVAVARQRFLEQAVRSNRATELVTLGRFSAQMAHDIRNPLSAVKGAAQLLHRDLGRPKHTLDHREFAALILEQVGRMETILARYRGLSRLEVRRSPIQVNEVARAVLERQMLAVPEGVVLRGDLSAHLPTCLADEDLIATVLENLVQNAVEAMPSGGEVTIRSRESPHRSPSVELAVEDTGAGMDARTRESAAEDFFTTKPRGSGLGLAFARRVAEAHGGQLRIESEVGRGTCVRLWLPSSASTARG